MSDFVLKYPNLEEEWHTIKNGYSMLYYMTYVSRKDEKVWWLCRLNPCGCHVWKTTIYSRLSGSGCPYCSRKKACAHYNLLVVFPELCLEWDHVLNQLGPDKYSPGSMKVVYWVCRKGSCDCHRWSRMICRRTNKTRGIIKSGCPYCLNRMLCPHNNLLATNPVLCLEWDYFKNLSGPHLYAPKVTARVWWLCPSGHSWEASISNRTRNNPTGCPVCPVGARHSKVGLEWLRWVSRYYGITIQTAESEEREYKVYHNSVCYQLDGYCEFNGYRCAFEFDGCYYHGCELCYDQDDIHPNKGKTFGTLQVQTKLKKKDLQSLGFVVYSIRECEYRRMRRGGISSNPLSAEMLL